MKLSFVVECLGTRDVLSVSLNGVEIYSELPDCDEIKFIEFDVNESVIGRNELLFESGKGRYSIDRIKVSAIFKKPENTVYYFDLTKKQIDRLDDDNLYLKMDFAYPEKEVIFYINNHKVSPKLDGPRYKYLLNKWVVHGENTLVFAPERSINIDSIEIMFE